MDSSAAAAPLRHQLPGPPRPRPLDQHRRRHSSERGQTRPDRMDSCSTPARSRLSTFRSQPAPSAFSASTTPGRSLRFYSDTAGNTHGFVYADGAFSTVDVTEAHGTQLIHIKNGGRVSRGRLHRRAKRGTRPDWSMSELQGRPSARTALTKGPVIATFLTRTATFSIQWPRWQQSARTAAAAVRALVPDEDDIVRISLDTTRQKVRICSANRRAACSS